jgi:hypothetical protein
MSWLPYILVLSALVLVQWLVRRAMGPVVSIGDEDDYISCGGQADPYRPMTFLRVPLMAWLSKQSHRYSTRPEQTLRLATCVASAATILVSMISAQILGGTQASLLIGFLLLFMPGRIILSYHIWPDIWLGLWLSLVCLILVWPGLSLNLSTILLGVVAALAFMTRFDALLLAPFAGFGLMPLSFWQWMFILLPTLLVFAGLSIRNARRYKIPWPDNTWMFNMMIAAGETEQKRAEPIRIEPALKKACEVWNQQSQSDRFTSGVASLRKLAARPGRAFTGLLLRVWASLGPDSFVSQRLLPPIGRAYPEISGRFNHGLQFALRFAFPMFASATFLALLVAKLPAPAILWPILALAVATLIHNRTRYRQAWLPGAALLLVSAVSTPGFWSKLLSVDSAVEWLLAISLAVALVRFRVRFEE